MNPDLAKVVTILSLGLGSMLFGLLPAALSRYNLRQNLLLQTVLLCFGAGILMATSLVHILPEVSFIILITLLITNREFSSFAHRFVKTWEASKLKLCSVPDF